MKIVIIGAKSSGKSSLGRELARVLGIEYIETDEMLENLYNNSETGKKISCGEIFDRIGADNFRKLEEESVKKTADFNWKVIITGGSTFVSSENRKMLRRSSIILFCRCDTDILLKRLSNSSRSTAGLRKSVFQEWYKNDIAQKDEIYRGFSDIVLDTGQKSPHDLAKEARGLINTELAVRSTSANTFGEIIRLTTFGESHGRAVGAVLEGLQPGISVTAEDIQKELDRRRPGQSRITSPRQERDRIEILSGIFNGKTTGTPIALVVYNKDSDSSKYEEIKHLFRPGHADITFFQKYFIRDYRGGGRSSGRETAARVAGGAVAKKILADRGIDIFAHSVEIGGVRAEKFNQSVIEQNIARCGDNDSARKMIEVIEKARGESDSVGGIVQLEIHGLPPGLGDPVFAKLDARLTYALMTIGAVKGIEVGKGFKLSEMRGSGSNDEMENKAFLTNNAGGILGGISTGQPVILRMAIKPTPSISSEQKTIDKSGRNETVSVRGRHDPCIIPRIIPVAESMAALVVIDAWEVQSRINPGWKRE